MRNPVKGLSSSSSIRLSAAVAVLAALGLLAVSVNAASAAAPIVSIGAPSAVTYTSAHVVGTIDPRDEESYSAFEFSTDEANWTRFSYSGPFAPGTGVANVEGDLGGLEAGTQYFVRLLALDPVENTLAVTSPPYPTFTTDPVAVPTVSLDPVTTFTATTAHLSGQINPNAPEAAPTSDAVEAGFRSHWHFECTPECPGLSGAIDADNSAHPVQAEATGLQPNTTYEVRLVATNAGGSPGAGPQTFKTAAVAPAVQTLYAGGVTPTGGTLAARVNPKNSAVTYQFEWGADESYGNVTPVDPMALGNEDNTFHVVTATLVGLIHGTSYHFRIVARNTVTGAVSDGLDHTFQTLEPVGPPPPCPNAAVRTQQGSSSLPDCRAFEKVSIDDKNEYDVLVSPERLSTASGDKVHYVLGGPVPGGPAGTEQTDLMAVREGGSWVSTSLSPPVPNDGARQRSNLLLSDDLSQAVVGWTGAVTSDTPPEADGALYLRDGAGQYHLLTPHGGGGEVLGADLSFGHIVYGSGEPQTFDAPAVGLDAPYEWADGQLRLVSVLPDPDGPGPMVGSPWSGEAVVGSGSNGTLENAVSGDGHRIAFETLEEGVVDRGQIYSREDGSSTIHVSASQRTDCAADPTCGGDGIADPAPDPTGSQAARYLDAESEHGGEVLFTSCERLTDDSTAHPDPDNGACFQPPNEFGSVGSRDDLYLYNVQSDLLTDLTGNQLGKGSFLGLVGASDDLSSIYFADTRALAEGANQGEANLYLWRQGQGVQFVTTLASDPAIQKFAAFVVDEFNWKTKRQERVRVVRTSADGRFLLFTSRAQLTPFANASPSPACPFERCAEVYLFDAQHDSLECVSCPALGTAPTVDAELSLDGALAKSAAPLPRSLAEDGQHVFFETGDPLVGGDINGKTDVYEWDHGIQKLISGGTGSRNSSFIDASQSGDDVFFTTRNPLIGSDDDTFADLYDARVVGGFPEPTTPPTPCLSAETCHGGSSASDSDPGPQTPSFVGPNDASAVRCSGNKIRRRGRCVKKTPRKHSGHRRASHNGGGKK